MPFTSLRALSYSPEVAVEAEISEKRTMKVKKETMF